MSYALVTHETYGRVLFNTETQGFVELPDTSNKIALSGRLFDYFETLKEFIESDKTTAVVLFFCKGREIVYNKKKQPTRYKVILMDGSFDPPVEFFNIEKIDIGWIKHESDKEIPTAPKTGIEICYTGSAYLVFLVKESDCLNGVRVKSVKKMEGKI